MGGEKGAREGPPPSPWVFRCNKPGLALWWGGAEGEDPARLGSAFPLQPWSSAGRSPVVGTTLSYW